MKKYTVCLYVLLIAFVLVGCGKNLPPLAEGLEPPILQTLERVPQTDEAPPNATEALVSREQAVEFVQPILDRQKVTGECTTALTLNYVRPNFFWEDGGPYKEADCIRLAWSVTVSLPADHATMPNKALFSVDVDARTGEILGGHAFR